MFGSWFGKPHARRASENTQQGLLDSANQSAQTLDLPPPIPDDVYHGAQPPSYSSPHDAVLAELEGYSGEPRSRSHTVASQGRTVESYDSAATTDPPLARRRTHGKKRTSSARTSAAEIVYDPFTGQLLGTLHPRRAGTPSAGSSGGGAEDSEAAPADEPVPACDDAPATFDAARDELWGHLGRIRTLQSEIAALHVQMEGAALGERKPSAGRRMSSTVGGTGRPSTSVSGSGADWEDEEDEEAEARREREVEFGRLAGRFDRRKEAVDGVMGKLDELAKTLTSFHVLQTPVNTFPRSRSNTVDNATSFDSGGYNYANTMPPSSYHGPGQPATPGRFSAPGPRFDSSPALVPRVLLSPDIVGSPPRTYAQLSGSPARPHAPLIVEEPQGFEA